MGGWAYTCSKCVYNDEKVMKDGRVTSYCSFHEKHMKGKFPPNLEETYDCFTEKEKGVLIMDSKVGYNDGVLSAENGKYRLEIKIDPTAPDPREWAEHTVMLCGHQRYDFGDRQVVGEGSFRADLMYDVRQEIEEENIGKGGVLENVVYLPLYLLDHSGLFLSSSPFRCRWDSGQIGFIYMTPKMMESVGIETEEEARKFMQKQVDEYAGYLQGYCYRFVVTEKNKCVDCGHVKFKLVDSLGTWYGDIGEALPDMKKQCEVEEAKELFDRIKEWRGR